MSTTTSSSAAEGLVKNQDLMKRINFTLICLAIFRFGVYLPTPGIKGELVTQYMSEQGGLLGLLNTFTGGALNQFSVFALGIMPYISSSIIFQLLTSAVPYLENLKKEGEHGRKKITQLTRWGTVVLCLFQGFAFTTMIKKADFGGRALYYPEVGGIPFEILTIITLTAGTCFIMWLGEQISERGLGEGASLIIYGGIAAGIPKGAASLWSLVSKGQMNGLVAIILIVLMLCVIGAIIFMEVAQRRIPIHISQKGPKSSGQVLGSYLPLKINLSGVIPPIFASSLLLFPSTIAGFTQASWLTSLQSYLGPGGALYNIVFVALIVFFCFFYTEVVLPPNEMAENLKKAGKFIPGVRAGKSTAEFIQKVTERINVLGAIYLSVICILPSILISKMNVPFYFGGTSLLILVGVALNFIEKINAYRYEELLKAAQRPRQRRRVSF